MFLYGRAGRLTAENGGFRPGQDATPFGQGSGTLRARSHCRFAPPFIHFIIIPDSLTYSVPLFLKRQCDRTPGTLRYKGNCSTERSVMPPCSQANAYPANRCPLPPRGDLLSQRNPMCDVRTTLGGWLRRGPPVIIPPHSRLYIKSL